MKQLFKSFRITGTLALLALLVSCASTPQATPDLLAAAGFQPKTADTPEKQALLKSLPASQVSLITWKGKSFYVQPDVANNRAYVGTPKEYQAYQQLRLAKQMSNDNLMAAQMTQDSMAGWNAWGPGMYGGFYGGRFR
jgi:hypothetical protein